MVPIVALPSQPDILGGGTMATIDGPKYTGALTIDLSDVKDDLVDLAPGAMKGIRAEQDGLDKVKVELAQSMPAHGDAADIPPQAYQRFLKRTALLAQLRTHEIELEKALEICKETRAKTENDREDDISIIAQAAQKAAERQKDPGVAAPFEETIRYNSQIADKGAQTRKKNAEAKAEAEKKAPPTQGG
jgi:hypothetical protein